MVHLEITFGTLRKMREVEQYPQYIWKEKVLLETLWEKALSRRGVRRKKAITEFFDLILQKLWSRDLEHEQIVNNLRLELHETTIANQEHQRNEILHTSLERAHDKIMQLSDAATLNSFLKRVRTQENDNMEETTDEIP